MYIGAMNPTQKILLTRQDAATRAGVSLRTVARRLADGTLTKHRDAFGRVRVDQRELDRMAAAVPVPVRR